MNIKALLPVIALFALPLSRSFAANTSWATDFSDAIIARWPGSINDMTGKGWEYTNGIVLQGIERTYAVTKDTGYLAYIKKYVDKYVGAGGSLNFDAAAQSLDKLHPGILLLFLYNETRQQKYKTAADKIFAQLKSQPTNASGGFWHKKANANHMLLDGIYMAHPFLAKYGYQIGEQAYCDSMAAFQILLLSSHVYVPSKKLCLHGWDETKRASWADRTTGLSSEIWSRATGWFTMALVDVLRYFPKDHPEYPELVTLLGNMAEGIKNFQDPATGLWYQVVDKGSQTGNWLESSGSGMMVYALKTAVDCGFIDKSYLSVAQKGWAGMKTKFTRDRQKLPVINSFAGSMNVLDNYAAYVAKQAVNCPPAVHTHGYCAALMAASAMELSTKPKYRLTVTTAGQGSVNNVTGELFHDSGATVTLTAVPGTGYRFDSWGGDAAGSELTAAIDMNAEKTVTATFVTGPTASAFSVSDFRESFSVTGTRNRVYLNIVLEAARTVSIALFNCRGEKTRTIKAGYWGRGAHSITLDSRRFASGTYFVRVQTGGAVFTLPLVMVTAD